MITASESLKNEAAKLTSATTFINNANAVIRSGPTQLDSISRFLSG